MNIEIYRNLVYKTDVVPLSWHGVEGPFCIISKFHNAPFIFGEVISASIFHCIGFMVVSLKQVNVRIYQNILSKTEGVSFSSEGGDHTTSNISKFQLNIYVFDRDISR
jgi:hypothetical protein